MGNPIGSCIKSDASRSTRSGPRLNARDLLSSGLIFCCAVLAVAASPAAESAAATARSDGAPASVQARVAEIREALASADLDEAARAAIEAVLAQATTDDRAAEEMLKQAAALEAEAAPTQSDAAPETPTRRDPQAEFDAWQAQLPRQEPLEALERRLTATHGEVDQLRQALVTAGASLAESVSSAATLAEDLAAQRRVVEERRAAASATSAALDDSTDLSMRARAVAAAAAMRRAVATLHRLETVERTLPARQRLIEARRRQLDRDLAAAELRAEHLQSRVAQYRADAVTARRTLLLSEQAEYAADTSPLHKLAAENVELVERLIGLDAELADRRRAAEAAARAAAVVEESRRSTESRLALGTADAALGLVLLRERQRLVEPVRLQSQLAQVRRRLASAHLSLIDLSEKAAALDDLPKAVRAAIAESTTDEEEGDQTSQREGYHHLLRIRADLLPELLETTRQLTAACSEQERALQSQLLATRALLEVLDRRLLWVPSHEPVNLDWLWRQTEGWADLLRPARFATSAALTGQAALTYWPMTLGLIVLVGCGVAWRRRLPAQLQAWAEPIRRVRDDRYSYTLKALGGTLVAALPAAVAVWGIAWLLQHAGESGKFTHSLGRSVAGVAPLVLLASLLDWLTRPYGLAHAHFRWTKTRRDALRGLRPWLIGLVVPLQLGLTLAFIRELEPARDTAGRGLMVAWCLLSAWLIWRLLAPEGVLSSRAGGNAGEIWRRPLRVVLPALQIGLVGLTLAGYLLTAAVLEQALWSTGFVLLAVTLLHSMLSRWFLFGERRLALRRYEQKQQAEVVEGRTSATGDAMPEIEPEEVTLQSIGTQTRRLLRAFTTALVTIAILWVWSDILPALDRLDEVVLWHVSAVGADGQAISESVALKSVLFGLVALLLTSVAARNLPGLMEIGLLTRINLDASTRYAITNLSRYVIVIGGLIIGSGLLGVRWSQLQWMAAALTVGLGFGMQEIFANFVSGVILLFERPFRVGDVITIADLTGTVTRIRTRATTLVDFDNKEIVIPNKSFITDRLVNWTLSDTRTRIVIKVGVAYGTDPETVHRLLQQVATENPLVLNDPLPRSWFIAFGSSTLDFELRVFVRSIEDRMRVLNDLNTRVATLFAEQGIEIAFPQLDLHVRNVAAPATAP